MDNRRQMHQAVCDSCGKDCEVPFRPTEGKPIYCTDCFRKKNDEGGDRGDRRGGGGRDRFGGRDRRGGRDRFGGRERHGGGGNDQVAEQIKAINNKLDRVINLLLAESPAKESPSKESTEKSEPKKSAAKKATPKTAKKPAKKAGKKK